jgi:hypothetical protein
MTKPVLIIRRKNRDSGRSRAQSHGISPSSGKTVERLALCLGSVALVLPDLVISKEPCDSWFCAEGRWEMFC